MTLEQFAQKQLRQAEQQQQVRIAIGGVRCQVRCARCAAGRRGHGQTDGRAAAADVGGYARRRITLAGTAFFGGRAQIHCAVRVQTIISVRSTEIYVPA